jgi:hypothetical protein
MKLPTLYELTEKYQQLLSLEDIPEEVMRDTLEGLEGEITEKCTNVAAVVRNFEALAEQIREAEKRMADRRRSIEARAEWLKCYLLENMERTGIEKIESPYFRIGIRKNPPKAEIVDENLIPMQYLEIPEPRISKKRILEDLKLGKEVPGAVLVNDVRVEIK